MKTLFANIYKAIATFVRTHTVVTVTTAVAAVVIAVAVPVGIHIARSSPDETSDTSQDIVDTTDSTEDTTAPDSTEFGESTSSETTDTSEGTTEPEDTTTFEETTKPQETTAPDSTEPAETKKPEPDHSVTSNDETSAPVVVQRADISTGISWDGVSPIIYTYPDGTTGTEPQIGATFESYPGRVVTVTKSHLPDDSSEPDKDLSVCDDCGRKYGDGTNGTCISYWTGGDHICEHCGVTIPVNTCHTCND